MDGTRKIDRQKERWIERKMDRKLYGQKARWIERQMDRKINGQKDRSKKDRFI